MNLNGIISTINSKIATKYNERSRLDQKETTANIDNVLSSLWIIGFIVALLLIFTIVNNGFSSSSSLIGAFAILISAGIASASVMKNISVTRENEQRKHEKEDSKFHLDKCSEGLKTFFELLKDGNNTREIWLEASRTLLRVLNLSEKITEQHHKNFFELEKSKYRHQLYTVFDKIFDRRPTNAHIFFTGKHNWEDTEYTLDDILDKMFHRGEIDSESVIAIFSFLDYPEDYPDPLDDQKVDALSFDTRKWPAAPQKYAARYIKYFQKDK